VPAPRRPAESGLPHTEHTVNGLRRRTPRAQRNRSETTMPLPAITNEPTVPVTASPEAVRDRLTALRAGIQRGSGQGRHAVNLSPPDVEPGGASLPRRREPSFISEEIP
jgi:hypothetical protein